MKKKSSRPSATMRLVRPRQSDEKLAPIAWAPAALLAALVALYVARVLVPEDLGGRQGHGAPFVALWLLAAGGWLLGQLRRGALVIYAGWADLAMLALVAWHTVSAVVVFYTGAGAPRPALNTLWDWVAIGVAYFLARQVLRSAASMRAAMVVMIGLACGLSAMAVHQSLATLPAVRAAYESIKDSTEMLYQQTGQWMPPGSSIRQQFETRLASDLSTGTFALSNSLGGFVVPWLVVLGGIIFAQIRALYVPSPNPSLIERGRIVVSSVLVALMMWCILLTGSRSAGIAAVAGLAVVAAPWVRAAVWPRPAWRRAGLAILILAVIGAAIIATTTAGRGALSSAWRSLAFRMEYWQATAAMIADNPLLGCGPGQFQDTYTAYKLPAAAEEVQDPHNWLLEVWATAGTPAAITLVVLLALVVMRAFHTGNSAGSVRADDNQSLGAQTVGVAALVGGVAGIALGTALAWWNNFALLGMQILSLAAGIVGVWWLLGTWIRAGTLSARLPLVAAGAILVNLLVAGGIGFASVADSLWLLVAMELNLVELGAGETNGMSFAARSRRAKLVGWAAGLGLAAVLLLALRTEYLPVMGCRWRLNAADDSLALGQADLYRASLDAAVAADPWSSQAAERLVGLRLEDFEKLPTAQQLRSFQAADARALALAPHRSGLWEKSGQSHAAIHKRTGDVEQLRAAIEAYGRAIELYPTNAEPRARLAVLLASADRTDEARTAAAAALALDDQLRVAGHEQQLLEPALREEVAAIAQPQP